MLRFEAQKHHGMQQPAMLGYDRYTQTNKLFCQIM